jgi:adenylate cyclase
MALALICSALFTQINIFTWADLQLHDWLTRSLPQKPPPPQVTVIDIDERSLSELGPWPWPRPVTARLMQTLREKGARLQVWDMFFADATARDQSLAKQLQNAPDIVIGQVLILDPKIQTPPQVGQLKASPQTIALCSTRTQTEGYFGVAKELSPLWVGHISATPDPDGRLRRLPAVLCNQAGQAYPQLALAAIMALAPQAPWQLNAGTPPLGPAHWLDRAGFRFPLDAQGALTIPYNRDHAAWPALSASQLLDASAQLPSLQGHIVIVGASALGAGDRVNTPRHPNAPGVSVQSELIGAALSGGWVITPQSPATFAAVLSLLLAFALLPLARPQRSLASIAGFMGLALAVPLLLALTGRLLGVMLPVAGTLLTLVIYGGALVAGKANTERRHAQQLALHLESFLPRRLAREIAFQTPGSHSLGKSFKGILLAVRVQGLERWTSSVDSLQALSVAHAASTLADHAARQHGGALEHVRGEVLLMSWPTADATCASAAIEAALALMQDLDPLLAQNESLRAPLSVHAAIESGTFLLGLAGPQSSRRVLLLGPAADIVLATLEMCADLGTPLLIGPNIAHMQPRQKLRLIGHFLLPDREQPRPLYRLAL